MGCASSAAAYGPTGTSGSGSGSGQRTRGAEVLLGDGVLAPKDGAALTAATNTTPHTSRKNTFKSHWTPPAL